MAHRCPQSKPLDRARLDGYRLEFRGYVDIVRDPLGVVWGGLYRLSPACVLALDKYEQAPRLYRQISVSVVSDTGSCDAMAYIMNKQDERISPELAYYTEIARGYTDWKLDEAPLRRARYAVIQGRRG